MGSLHTRPYRKVPASWEEEKALNVWMKKSYEPWNLNRDLHVPYHAATEFVQVSKVKPNSNLRPGLIKHITWISITTIQDCLGRGGFYSLGERGRGVCCCLLVLHMLFLESGKQTKKRMFVSMFLNYRRNKIFKCLRHVLQWNKNSAEQYLLPGRKPSIT